MAKATEIVLKRFVDDDINAQSRKPPPLRGVTGTRQPVALAAPSPPPPYVQGTANTTPTGYATGC